ncbi:MAG: tRNA (adenosine(37)-N6)-dimethylallyltransferase MiaA [Rickettsiaceae bacterium]|nr:tRNA (adenosine(37)-N6)-dimethylallyltransferase MiaA [Rickettsiaceae bacterium]
MSNSNNGAIIICGPTASGKTNLAHHLALHHNGEIVNADSMQLYKQLPIITACPDNHLRNELPYHLYNFQDVDKELSAAKYVKIAAETIKEISRKNKLPIIVGGSGMYINMLVNGYSLIPNTKDEIRIQARDLHKQIGAEAFFAELGKLDREIVDILNIHDTQRVIRAYEVFKQTGHSILFFQNQDNFKPLEEFDFQIFSLMPERQFLYKTCNERLLKLFANGAIEEVQEMYRHYGDLKTSAMKSLGVSEIISYIKGDITYDKAIELASARTRQYAKRQTTWFKKTLPNTQILEFKNQDEYQKLLGKTL